jgi:heat shock protein HslJ
MSIPRVPRRTMLRVGSAVITYGLFSTMAHANNDDPSPPVIAQVPAPPTPDDPLTRKVWLWQRSSYADGTSVVCSDPGNYTLTFLANGSYSVQADCNQGNGTYTVDGSQLTLQQGPMTLAACPPGSQDTVFLRDLGRVNTYLFNGENLVLNLQVDSGNMIFSQRPPVSLTGPTWQVIAVNNGRGALASVLAETQLDMTFGENGVVSGSTGCNAYRALYATAGTTITFGTAISTRRACLSEEAAAQEQAFLAALSASSRFELRGDRLTLRDDGGAAQVDMLRPTG